MYWKKNDSARRTGRKKIISVYKIVKNLENFALEDALEEKRVGTRHSERIKIDTSRRKSLKNFKKIVLKDAMDEKKLA